MVRAATAAPRFHWENWLLLLLWWDCYIDELKFCLFKSYTWLIAISCLFANELYEWNITQTNFCAILMSLENKYPCILARILAVHALAFSESKQGATGSCLWAALHPTSMTFRRQWFPYQSAGTLRLSARGLVSTYIIGESGHKYHFCRDKHVFVATNVILSRQKFRRDFVDKRRVLSRQKWYLWQLPPMIHMSPFSEEKGNHFLLYAVIFRVPGVGTRPETARPLTASRFPDHVS